MKKPDFLIIGGQKCGTTWLWNVLKQHPGTDLPKIKEIHYFGGIEKFRKGREWYFDHFRDIDPGKITGEASTTYLFDRIPYWYNLSNQIEYDESLPTIAELAQKELPNAKIVAILRDPIRRAISGYHHFMRTVATSKKAQKNKKAVFKSLRKIALESPKVRLLEYGFYSQHLRSWMKVYPKEQFKIFFFEEAVLKNPYQAAIEIYDFLKIDSNFKPVKINEAKNISWGWFTIMVSNLMPEKYKNIARNPVVRFLDRTWIAKSLSVSKKDLEFLKDRYKNEKENLENLLERTVPWR
jgi:hypothetical protein